MDRRDLRDALLAAGLPAESFRIDGVPNLDAVPQLDAVPGGSPIPTDFWFLRQGDGQRWEIGSYERGRFDVRERCDTEQAACSRLYTVLTGRPAEPADP